MLKKQHLKGVLNYDALLLPLFYFSLLPIFFLKGKSSKQEVLENMIFLKCIWPLSHVFTEHLLSSSAVL